MLKRSLSIVALIVAALITLYFYLFFQGTTVVSEPSAMDWSINGPENGTDTAFGGLFYDPYIRDSLPHYQYKRIEDSIKQIKDAIELNNKGFGGAISYGAIGLSELEKERKPLFEKLKDPVLRSIDDSVNLLYTEMSNTTDSASLKTIKKLLDDLNWRSNVRLHDITREEERNKEKLYYLALNGYEKQDYNTKFFIDKDTYNLAYVKWDRINKRTHDSTMVGHYERKQIPVRYSEQDKKILIPISKAKYQVFNIAINVVIYGNIFLCIYFFLGLPIQIIISISKGEAFTQKNIFRFKLMAYAVLAYTCLAMALPYILQFIFRKQIPADFTLEPFIRVFFDNVYSILIAIGLFVVAKAFQRGYKLQQENALTI